MKDAIKVVLHTYHLADKTKGTAEDIFDEISTECPYFKPVKDKFDGEEMRLCRHFHHPHKSKGLFLNLSLDCEARLCPLYSRTKLEEELEHEHKNNKSV